MHTIAVFKIYACICIVYFKDTYNRKIKLFTHIVYLISSKTYMIIYKKQILKLKRLN